MTDNRPMGFWVLVILGILILVVLFIGQMMSFINYEFTVSIGMQESVDVIGEMGVAVNKGFGVGDTIIYIPLLLFGIVGLFIRKKWGIYAMAGALGITAYWPVVAIFILLFAKGTPGFNFTEYTFYSILLTVIAIYGVWGLWYLFANRERLVKDS